MLLEAETSDHDAAQAKCQQYGAMLPEPKNWKENKFLDSLDSNVFPLGMRKKGNDWFWDSDGSRVVFMNWRSDQPDNDGDCVKMNKKIPDRRWDLSDTWSDLPCDAFPMSLVCQSKTGM